MDGLLPLIARVLPNALRRRVLRIYWDRFWKKEYRAESEALGVKDLPPISGSERAILVEQICASAPFRSLLEVGSGHGQNFDILARLFPGAQFVGVDSNQSRVDSSTQLFKQNNLTNVVFVQGQAEELSEFPDGSADIVVSSAMMLFVPPERVERVAAEMLRIARSSVFLLEQHMVDASNPLQYLGVKCAKDTGVSDYFLRDYFQLFGRFVPESAIHMFEVPNPRWEIEQWKKYAKVFKIDRVS